MAKKQAKDETAEISAESWSYIARVSIKRVALKAKLADRITSRDAIDEKEAA